jgi:putative chitinase
MITAEKLQQLGIGAQWVEPLTVTFTTFKIFTPKEQASFVAQCSHESNHFRVLEENLNYRADTLQKLFGHKFKPGEVELYAHKPEKIANRIYANRMGNRDEASGDGWRFHGRGCIQLTGHDNYWHYGQAVGSDFVRNPELIAKLHDAVLSAGWFWSTHGCNSLVDNPEGLCKRINGGLIGLDDRIAQTGHALQVFSA